MPLLVGHLVQHRVAIDPGVVDQNIQAAIALVRVHHDGVALRCYGHIQSDTEAGRTQARGHVRCVGEIYIGADDDGAFLGELAGDPFPDAAARAKRQRDGSTTSDGPKSASQRRAVRLNEIVRMKISTIASVTILGSTMAGSLMLGPVRQPVAPAAPLAQTLPSTGPQVAINRIRHGLDLEAPAAPTEIYEHYVPPPAPTPVPTAAPVAWVPSPGYRTIPVPIYRQTRNLNCETAALQMGLAYYGHYYSQDS